MIQRGPVGIEPPFSHWRVGVILGVGILALQQEANRGLGLNDSTIMRVAGRATALSQEDQLGRRQKHRAYHDASQQPGFPSRASRFTQRQIDERIDGE